MKEFYPYQVKITYPELDENGVRSNELHIWMIENFGLPGGRYMFNPEIRFLTYSFREEKDAIFFTLRWGSRIYKKETA